MSPDGTPRPASDRNGFVQVLLDDLRPRAKSLIITVYGDAIAPHGGTVWLGSLIRLVAPLGLNERLVRTAVLRLSRDGWLAATRAGRRSYYSLTESGRLSFEDAFRRIYTPPRVAWTGDWTLVFTALGRLSRESRARLGRTLTWQGFGVVAPGIFAHPTPDEDALRHALGAAGLCEDALVMTARTKALPGLRPLPDLLRGCWELERVAAAYRGFLDRFAPICREIEATARLDPQFCFLIRTLLMHEYRRVLLRDPVLPEALLPADWAGAAARDLCRDLYCRTVLPAERHLMSVLRTADGPLPAAAPRFYARFGGLPRAEALAGAAAAR